MRMSLWMGVGLCVALICGQAMSSNGPNAPGDPAEGEVAIQVSPAALNLDADGTWVTVHADIPLALVQRDSVQLDGLTPGVVKADDCGNLVAKFTLEDVKAIVAPPSATLTLTGLTVDGEPFAGTDTIRVVETDGQSGK